MRFNTSDYFTPYLKSVVALALLISVAIWKATAADSARGYDPQSDYTTNASGTLIYSTKAVEELRRRATNAYAEAQLTLGYIYSFGQGVVQDNIEAYMWLALAGAHQFSTPEEYQKLAIVAQLEFSVRNKLSLSEVGESQRRAADFFWKVTTNEAARARKMLDRDLNTIKQGDPDGWAANSLGHMYYSGSDVPQNFAEALKWYNEAVKKVNAEAFYKIGEMYEEGEGVPKDVNEAIRRYKLTAERGLDAIKTLRDGREREKAAEASAASAKASGESIDASESGATIVESNPISISNASAKVIETNRTYWKWSWKVTLKNNTSKFVKSAGVAVQFVDSAGYEIDHDSQLDVDVPPNQEVTATGTSEVALPNGRNIVHVRAKTF